MTEEIFVSWLKRLGEAWENRDAEAAANLFSADVCYRENPFDPPLQGRKEVEAYWREMLAEQTSVTFSFQVLAVTDKRSVVNWQARYTDVKNTGAKTREQAVVDGVSVGTFDNEGMCEQWLEWWHKGAQTWHRHG